ncbi:hypothetical protein JHV56_19180 [Arthrobacter sp. BHU FT2]|nr:hypothetical protein [Arthrobacter sp. BHU FT2]
MSDRPPTHTPGDGNGSAVTGGHDGAAASGADAIPVTPDGGTNRTRRLYLDPGGPESTRQMRDTARRRRDAEEKLRQHLLEARKHVPHGD